METVIIRIEFGLGALRSFHFEIIKHMLRYGIGLRLPWTFVVFVSRASKSCTLNGPQKVREPLFKNALFPTTDSADWLLGWVWDS